MRFVFVDRLVSAVPPRHIETLKNVSATEDVFTDHFPGYPVFPGALVVEAFGQASQLLIGMSHDFAEVGRLRRLSRVAFRRQVRPGDQLKVGPVTFAVEYELGQAALDRLTRWESQRAYPQGNFAFNNEEPAAASVVEVRMMPSHQRGERPHCCNLHVGLPASRT